MSVGGGPGERSRVLVTGAAGFIGGHVRRALTAAGHEVVAVDSMWEDVHGADAEPPQGVSMVDVRDADALAELLPGVDVVCHLAGAGPGAVDAEAVDSNRMPGVDLMRGASVFVAHNDAATAALLTAMERAGVRRLVLASSVAVYGEGRYRGMRGGVFHPGMRRRRDLDRGMFDHRAPRTGDLLTWEPVGEDAPVRPRSAYAASKVAQENYALAWAAQPGVSATVLRYHHVYGDPVCPVRTAEAGVVARFRAELAAGRAPHIFEDGGQTRDFVHVRDVAAATVAAVRQHLPGFVPLNIASGRPVTVWQVASLLAKALGGPEPVVTGRYRATDIRHLVANPERARRALDFTPRISPAQGLAAYATGTQP
ncbi:MULTISPECIES: NAD(P)-dependent oxidoreductase [unclassified Nocardia]|uniref:NAD-dependent epimerase/dehydratase family protein n=1 Tax=unclassified Nocardia TaxID=2637762 RepID=UPI00278C5946|nr:MULTISPECIES: NAD-dependent epimerase/dehydratase family protein [unclassified Nocardia]